MGCNCARQRIEVWQVEYADGTVKRFLTQDEAQTEKKNHPGAVYRSVTR